MGSYMPRVPSLLYLKPYLFAITDGGVASCMKADTGELIWQGGDVHLYLNHAELVEEQLSRQPAGNPKLHLLRKPDSIFDYEIEDFEVLDYHPQAHISAPVAV